MRISLYASIVLSILVCVTSAQAQEVLPNEHAPGEEHWTFETNENRGFGGEITTPPPFEVRTMAEWEEIQSIIITWAGFPHILKQIAFHAKEECEVIILADNQGEVTAYLNGNNGGGSGFDNLDNITILDAQYNSIWGRDYGAHTIYRDDVEELLLVDWIYNRNRPLDDATPALIAQHVGVPLYSTTVEPYNLMATGGNFMSDGMGTAFSSELIIEENSGGSAWWTDYPDHSVEEIEGILEDFMGIDRYIKMEVLPYDLIHHIDMHMKLLDEETILLGEYPDGIADGPQIEANIEYVLSNYDSPFGTPYEVVRVQMPPESGSYPNTNGDYRTYTNLVFINGTVLVPIYEEEYDLPALEIIQAELPGYNVVGIECNDIIQLSGAIHCITKAVGVDDPVLIVHQPVDDMETELIDVSVDARVQHLSGIASAQLNYRLNGGDFATLEMELTDAEENIWSGTIPGQAEGTIIDYYVLGTSVTGKQQSRPITAPEGFWTYEILETSVGLDELNNMAPLHSVYPNPSNGITVVPINMPQGGNIELSLIDLMGREVVQIHSGGVVSGEQKFFFDASNIAPGVYQVQMLAGKHVFSQKLMIR